MMGFEIDIKSLTGEEEVDLTDNVYEYFMRGSERVYDESAIISEIVPEDGDAETEETDAIRVIELTGGYPDVEEEHTPVESEPPFDDRGRLQEEEINDSEIVEPKVRNRVTCHFCNSKISTMRDSRRSYVFEEKNNSIFTKNLMQGGTMPSKVICTRCLDRGFRKMRDANKRLSNEEYIVVREGIKMYYKRLNEAIPAPSKKKTKRVSNSEYDELDGDIIFQIVSDKAGEATSSEVQDMVDDLVVRRKIANNADRIVKRKIEMDGTISMIVSEEAIEPDRKRLKSVTTNLICRACRQQLGSLEEVIQHSYVHQDDTNLKEIFCVLCFQYFKNETKLANHLLHEHISYEGEMQEECYLDENDGSLVKRETKKEENREEHETEDYMTDRLQKYLTGEIDAETFFQQECFKGDSAKNVAALNNIINVEDDDDVIVCIVAEKSDDESEYILPNTKPAIKSFIESTEDVEKSLIDCKVIDDVMLDNLRLDSTENPGIEDNPMEEFEEVNYFDDPEYVPDEHEPEDEDIDNESITSTERRSKRRAMAHGKFRCETCLKAYTSQVRLEQHKCYLTSAPSPVDKKDLTCSICNESFLTKVRLQFHKQTHKEGGWQQMGCEQCPRKDFGSENELFDHVFFFHMKPFYCPFEGCNKTFKIRKLLKTHIKDHGTKRYGCPRCGLRFQLHQTLKEHMVLHMEVKPFQCHICQKYMSKASRLRMHLLVHTSQQLPTHVLACRLCDVAFKDVQEAEAHLNNPKECEPREEDKDGFFDQVAFDFDDIRQKWKRAETMDDNSEFITSKQTLMMQLSNAARNLIIPVWIDKVFCCQYCEKVYYTKEALHQHRKVHYKANYPYQCHLCEAKFLTYARCTAHKSTHGYFKEGGAPSLRNFPVVKHYLCDICDKSNLLWTTVSVHYRHHHKHNNQRNPPPCRTCHNEFHFSWDLGKHRRMKHRREVFESSKAPQKIVNFTYKCTECNKELPTKSALTSHRKVAHRDDGQTKSTKNPGVLVCTECGKTYATKPALLTHIKWHTEHGIGKEAAKRRKRAFGKGSHICSICGLGFYSAANLRAHIERIHEKTFKYTCEECGKGHYTHMEMETHKLTHTGERPYKCPDCPRAYVTKAILNKHYRNHTGERPYSCDICGATFKTAHSRNYHKQKHEKGKLPAPFIVLEVKGGNPKELQDAINASFKVMGKDGQDQSLKYETKSIVKNEIEEFHQEVNEEEVLVQTSVDDDMDEGIIPMQEETQDGVQIVYKRVVRSMESGCENEYTIEYEEA